MQDIVASMGDRNAMLAREMTKLHEEFIRGSVTQILKTLEPRAQIKGECTLLVAGFQEKAAFDAQIISAEIEAALKKQGSALSAIAKLIAQKYGLPKNEVYDLALKISARLPDGGNPKSTNRKDKA